VQLNMDGLLGRKEQEDQYIRALLLVDGITCVAPLSARRRGRLPLRPSLGARATRPAPLPAPRRSVTVDRTRAVAIVYTHEEREMKAQLYDVVQGVCDKLRDAAGLRRLVVRKNDRATYLEEDDDDDDDDGDAGDDFFGGGAGKLVVVGGAAAAAPTAADRLAAKDANCKPAAASGGLLTSWFGW